MAEVNEYITAGIIAIVIILLIGGGIIMNFYPEISSEILDVFIDAKDIFREEWHLTEPEIQSYSIEMFNDVFDSIQECLDTSEDCFCELNRGDFADSRYSMIIENFDVGAKAVLLDQDGAIVAEREFPGKKIGTLVSIEGEISNQNNIFCYYDRINIGFVRSIQEFHPG